MNGEQKPDLDKVRLAGPGAGVVDADNDGIDDRWLDKAAEHRRQIVSLETQMQQASAGLANMQKRLEAELEGLKTVKVAITTKAPFPEPAKK